MQVENCTKKARRISLKKPKTISSKVYSEIWYKEKLRSSKFIQAHLKNIEHINLIRIYKK